LKKLYILRESERFTTSPACVDLALLGARAALNLATPDESAFAVQLGEGHAALVALVAAENIAAVFAARRYVAFAVLDSCGTKSVIIVDG
jgi:hypothetical protein